MIRRLYIHNFRCLENFELPVGSMPSALLIGKNGSGKTTVSLALEMLQKIARGSNRVGDLVKVEDFTRGRREVPMRFELEVELHRRIYSYLIALELPPEFKELRVLEESLTVDGREVYGRQRAEVSLTRIGSESGSKFRMDWHTVALPVIQEQSKADPVFLFRQWLARILILRPIPALIGGESTGEILTPNPNVADLAAWFTGVVGNAPEAYSTIRDYLKEIFPDLLDIQNPTVGTDAKSLIVRFSLGNEILALPLRELSDGEKCFLICALVLAANRTYGPLLCFWDEPDNYLATDEVGHFILAIRKAFRDAGQFIATSHNIEAISKFPSENTIVLLRNSHLEPTVARKLGDLGLEGDLYHALLRGDLR